MRNKQPISVLVVIYTQALEVLVLERADFTGAWQSVTGSRDDDETLFETACREVFEETGLDVKLYPLTDWQVENKYEIYTQWLHRYPPGTTHNIEHVFGLQLPGTLEIKLSPREHVKYQWLSWKDAAQLVFSPSNREAILQLPVRVGK